MSSTTRRPSKAELKQARIAAAARAAAAAKRRSRNIRLALWSAVGFAVVVVAVVAIVVINRPAAAKPGAAAPTTASGTQAAGTQNVVGGPPWGAPRDASAAVAAAGLSMLDQEGTALHIHAHLDVFANGAPVTVPAELGIDEARQKISPLHSHDTSGVIHIESPDKSATFTLGEFFAEWQVSLSADHIGGLTVDGTHQLKAYVDGKLYTGDPAAIPLTAHEEIAVVYGTDAQQPKVPTSYAWSNGL